MTDDPYPPPAPGSREPVVTNEPRVEAGEPPAVLAVARKEIPREIARWENEGGRV
jgi:hypothetical protein